MPSERSLSSDDRDREDAPEIMERWALEEVLYVILCFFFTDFIINKDISPVYFKNCGSLRNSLAPFLGRLERVMEGSPRKESTRILHSNNPKGSWKGCKGKNPSVGGFRMDKVKDIRIRIRPNPFLEQPERVMERMQREETPRLEVSKGIRLRISR